MVGVTVTEQLPADSVHVPPGVNVTIPVGVTGVPIEEASATVAVHVVEAPMDIVLGVQLTVVVVARRVTAMVAVPLLAG